MLGNRSWDNWIAQYSESHRHPLNQLTHTFGIPMILASIPLMLAGIRWRPLLWFGLTLFIAGWALQFLGHAIEGKPPEFLSDWRFLLVGSRWWVAKVRGKL
jgi:uncharacterized membrane protein YGL010W